MIYFSILFLHQDFSLHFGHFKYLVVPICGANIIVLNSGWNSLLHFLHMWWPICDSTITAHTHAITNTNNDPNADLGTKDAEFTYNLPDDGVQHTIVIKATTVDGITSIFEKTTGI